MALRGHWGFSCGSRASLALLSSDHTGPCAGIGPRIEEPKAFCVRNRGMTLRSETWYSRPMDASGLANRALKWTLAGASLVLGVAVAVGCDRADAQTSEIVAQGQEHQRETTGGGAETVQAKAAGQPSYNEEAFQLSFEAPPAGKVGVPLTLKVVLVAKNGYKVNDEYPIKFKFDENAGVKAAKDTVRKEDAKLEKMRVEMPMQVTIAGAGATSVSGRLSFSVCTEERCLIEKRDLKVNVNAS